MGSRGPLRFDTTISFLTLSLLPQFNTTSIYRVRLISSQRLLSMATPPERVVGVVYVVDSSLTLASEWSTVLKDYISHLLQRIMALYHPAQVCQRSFRLRHYSTC